MTQLTFPTLTTVKHVPIEISVLHVAVVLQHFRKKLSQEFVIGRFFEAKFSDVIQIDTELLWKTVAKILDRRRLFLLSDLFVLLLIGCGFETLPR